MGYVIAMAGKGGTGKTTIAALIVRLIKEKKLGSVLAIDADPNSNLGEVLGLKQKSTIGEILDEISTHPEKVPVDMGKDHFIEYQVQTAIVEGEGFDVLTMGRPEGPGCYCYVNNALRNVMGKLIKDYDYVVIDNEAGLEHLSRRTTRSADAFVVVSNASAVGLKAAKRIRELIKELKINVKKELLVINSSQENIEKQRIDDLKLDYLGSVPYDMDIEKISLNGNSLMDLNEKTASLSALRKIGERIWQRN
ncbi:MAG: AAA family ATPase [Candidatus Omnitrophica bacterium]|nr:AAA family ATPase [Candidatus Omnitrophota bacterium]MBU1868919.1 AAA family ATPase [Candidatus Omnitrophota bacterium]